MPRIAIAPALLAVLLAGGAPLAAADDHAGHAHAGHAHGPVQALGRTAVGAQTVAAAASGDLRPGGVWHVELRLEPAQPAPRAVRLWVGNENGRGSAKARAAAEPGAAGEYGAHVEIPAPLPAGARLWIAIEPEGGPAVTGALDLPVAPAGHHAGDGHAH